MQLLGFLDPTGYGGADVTLLMMPGIRTGFGAVYLVRNMESV
jgi:hypothetical protein